MKNAPAQSYTSKKRVSAQYGHPFLTFLFSFSRIHHNRMLPFLPGRKKNITLAQRLHPSSTPIREAMTLSPEDVPQWIEYSDRFHLLFYDYCNNSRLTHAAEKLRSQFTIFSNLYETETAPQKKSIRCIQKFTTHIAVGIIPKPVI